MSTAFDDQNTDQSDVNNSNLDENPNFMTSPSQPLANNESHDSISKRTFEVTFVSFFLVLIQETRFIHTLILFKVKP